MISAMQSPHRNPRLQLAQAWGTIVAGLFVMGLVAISIRPAAGQIQMDQVEPIASQLGGVTEGQLVVTLPGDCEPAGAECGSVSRSDVLTLVPGGLPFPQTTGEGNSAVVVQRSSASDARVDQVGTKNEASITQLNGSGNEAMVEQSGGLSSGGVLPGRNNLAVIVQNGSINETALRQWGDHNLAGIRLVGTGNAVTVHQDGAGNQYLLDFTGSGLGSGSSSLTHQVSQIGSDNQLVQVGSGRMPFNVRQQGNGMRMRIQHHGAP